jgi:peptide/nickel transport system permease protein
MIALAYVLILSLVALAATLIVGTRPVVCRYKGELYFPGGKANPIFIKDRFRNQFPVKLKEKDPDSWAIWPLIYQAPDRRVRSKEWEDSEENKVWGWRFRRPVAANPGRNEGRPSVQNLMGTTSAGWDVFAIMVHGTRTALLVGFVSMGIAAAIGVTLGACAGYFGGLVDTLISRLIEVVMCVPQLVLILALLAVVEKSTIWHVMVVLGVTGWTSIARLTRGEFLKLREADFVAAAQALGVGRVAIIFRHILRNALAPILVPVAFGIASAILVESALSFLGFGTSASSPSWGMLLREGQRDLTMWWLLLFPGLGIFLTVLAYNLIGEGLQEATDPRLREDG